MSRERSTQGYTLVELMVVVAIIGILVGIAVASYSVAIARAQAVSCASTRNSLNRSLEVYYSQTGHYPVVIGDLRDYVVNWDRSSRCPAGPLLEYSSTTHTVSCPIHGQ